MAERLETTDAQRVVSVDFAATGGEAQLTWGQRAIWQAMVWMGDDHHWFNLSHVFTIADGVAEATVIDVVRAIMTAHEGLRTRFSDYLTNPRQQVHTHGSIPIACHETTPGQVDATAEAVRQQLGGRSFRHEDEWPIRLALITAADKPRRLVVALSHQVIDGGAWHALRQQFEALAAGGSVDVDTNGWQPLRLAEFEASASGARRSAFAAKRWRADLPQLPASIFDYPTFPADQPRFVVVTMRSTALAAAAQRLSDRLETTTSTILLTAVTMVLAYVTDHPQVTLQLIVANRNRPELTKTLAPMTENGLFAATVGELSFVDAVAACWNAAFTAFRTAQYDPVAINQVLSDVQHQCGTYVDRQAFFNDVRPVDRWELPADTTDVLASTELTTVEVTETHDRLGLKAFFTVRTAPDHAALELRADTAYLPRAASFTVLRAIESLVVRAVSEPVGWADLPKIVDITPMTRDDGWVQVGPGWCHLPAVGRFLADLDSVGTAAVFTEPRPDGSTRLIGYLTATDPAATLAMLHREASAKLVAQERTDVMLPHEYVLCAASPADPDLAASWRACDIVATGDGRHDQRGALGQL